MNWPTIWLALLHHWLKLSSVHDWDVDHFLVPGPEPRESCGIALYQRDWPKHERSGRFISAYISEWSNHRASPRSFIIRSTQKPNVVWDSKDHVYEITFTP